MPDCGDPLSGAVTVFSYLLILVNFSFLVKIP